MNRFSKRFIILAVVIIIIITGLIIAYVINNDFSALEKSPFSTSKINVLIAGYDSSENGRPRADTIILASVDMDENKVGLLFIPRDTRVDIPGYGYNKINASHAVGGIDLLTETVESFLDIPIDYYVDTDFEGFSNIINIIGGIKINVEKPLEYEDEAADLEIDLPEGRQVLMGEEALHYVRYREETYGDIGRISRQQKFIKALIGRLLKPDMIVKLPRLYDEFKQSVETNVTFQDVTPFAKLVKNINLDEIETEMLPGEPEYREDVSYWIYEEEETEILVDNLIRSKEYIKNKEYNINILNGNGKSGLASEVSDKLSKYGFNIDEVGNASDFDFEETIIRYYDTRDKNTVIGIQNLLGGKIEYIEEDEEDEDDEYKGDDAITVIIGNDYSEESI
ncbi:MAG: LCP family protein [Halanaerobiaceae bacterium]